MPIKVTESKRSGGDLKLKAKIDRYELNQRSSVATAILDIEVRSSHNLIKGKVLPRLNYIISKISVELQKVFVVLHTIYYPISL